MNPRVLVVDDHSALAETIADGLAENGYDAVAISSSREAAERLLREPFDALVTDLRMPGLDGLELLKISHAAAPTRPVIVMTGFSADADELAALRHGAVQFLGKPFRLQALLVSLRRALPCLEDAPERDEE